MLQPSFVKTGEILSNGRFLQILVASSLFFLIISTLRAVLPFRFTTWLVMALLIWQVFSKLHWIRICGWLINFLASVIYLIFPLGLQMVYALHKAPFLRIILALQECDQQPLNKTLRALKRRLSSIHMKCFHFYYRIVARVSDWNMVYVLTFQTPTQQSCTGLSELCFLVNHGLELQPFWPAIKLTHSLKHMLLYNEFHWRKK